MFNPFKKTKKTPEPLTVLIVDDEDKIVLTLKDMFEMHNYKVFTAENGQKGLQIALKEQPDITVIDIMMPVMDGHEMLEALRQTEEGKNLPVIMLTARGQVEDIAKSKTLGIDDYIVKPFSMKDLLVKVRKSLQDRQAANQTCTSI